MTLRPVTSIVAVALGLALSSAQAQAPQTAPGFYRWTLGAIEVTALWDGDFELDTDAMLTDTAGVPVAALLARANQSATIPVSVNAYLVDTGRRIVLVDTGAAQRFGPTLGRLASSLRASGYRPEQVDDILVTHMHPDHVGGLLAEGARAFPHATVHVERREAAFWLDPAARRSAPADRQPFFDAALASTKPYVDAGAFDVFDAPGAPLAGIRATAATGHTPGHTVYAIESQGQRLLFWGDLMEIAAVQLAAPQVTIVFDADPAAAAALRPRAYADAASAGTWIAVAHLPFPGIGQLRKEGDGYAWIPVAATPAR